MNYRYAVRVLVVGILLAQFVAGVFAPPDPYTQIVVFGVAAPPAVAAACALVGRDGRHPNPGGVRPSTAFVVAFLLGFGVVGVVGRAAAAAVAALGDWSLAAPSVVTDVAVGVVAALVAEWVAYRGGYRRLRRAVDG